MSDTTYTPRPLFAKRLASYVSRVRAYLHSDEGRANVRRLMRERGWSYQQVVAESVLYVTRLVIYEYVTAVTDQVIIEELEPSSGEAA